MIELGIVQLVQSDPTVSAIAPTGGFAATLPKDFTLPSWTYRAISEPIEYTLRNEPTVKPRRLQIDLYGAAAADCIRLGNAIDAVLSGFRGTLPDSPPTAVQGIFRTNLMDPPFDDAGRTYRRILEYQIWY